jgi:hypothetical protein
MTAAKLHRIFRILSTAGLSLVYEENGHGETRRRPSDGVPQRSETAATRKQSNTPSR